MRARATALILSAVLILLSSLLQAPAAAPPAIVAPAADEIVVTARRDKCFVAYAKHPVTDQQLVALSQSWAAGTPVRVIEPRGASIRCEFQIMQTLAKHGAHAAEFVPRAEDLAEDDPPSAPPSPEPGSLPAVVPPPAYAGPAAAPPSPPVVSSAPSRRGPVRLPVVAASSGIVTLLCTMQDPARPYQLDVEVDEARGTVTPSRPDTGGGSEMKALFLPEAVRFGPFTLSRVTLRIRRTNGGVLAPGEAAVIDGQCALAEPTRVF